LESGKEMPKQSTKRKGGFLGSIRNTFRNIMKKGDKTRKKFTKMNCNPAIEKDAANAFTCYTKDILAKLKRAYNTAHPDEKIGTTDPTAIVQELRDRLLPKCKKEDCWLNMLPPDQRKVIDDMVFAPDQPKEWKNNPDEWLSNFDMIEVLQQYEKAYPNFRILGPTPIDFDTKMSSGKCVWDEICKFKYKEFEEKGVTDVAFIFNLDEHDKGGSHWTSMYLNIPKRQLFYLDSALNDFPEEIEKLVDRILQESKMNHTPFRFDKNTRQHQYGNSECGMYALFFIITLLTGKYGGIGRQITFERALKIFRSKRIPDNMVFKFRNKYFNKAEGGGREQSVSLVVN
jgi:Ulp1 protease family, C-terminal catalytic domain